MNPLNYYKIAQQLKICLDGQKPYGDFVVGAVESVILQLAEYFESNEGFDRKYFFDREQFLKDCGLVKQ